MFNDDPWAPAAAGSKDRRTTGGVWARYKPTSKPEAMQVEPSDGATDMIVKQANRLTEVETQLRTLQEQMNADQKANQARFQQLDCNVQNMGSQLKITLEEALKQQSASLISTFDALLKRSPRNELSKENDRSRSPREK